VDQPHGDIFSTGLRFEYEGFSISYSTDFHEFTDEMADLFAGTDVWVVDALRERPHPTHTHLALTLQAIDTVRPGQAILTHMDQSMDYAHLCARLPRGVVPGHDGMTVSIP
jgi:phosphoribosyl 1,2-cyclic phosphate phosphodiesterase